jgi:hypothetical protein
MYKYKKQFRAFDSFHVLFARVFAWSSLRNGFWDWYITLGFLFFFSCLFTVLSTADEWMLFYGDPQVCCLGRRFCVASPFFFFFLGTHPAFSLQFKTIKAKAFNMELRTSRFRHVAWMIHLGVMGGDPTSWPPQLAARRAEFEALKERHIIDPKSLPEADQANVQGWNFFLFLFF